MSAALLAQGLPITAPRALHPTFSATALLVFLHAQTGSTVTKGQMQTKIQTIVPLVIQVVLAAAPLETTTARLVRAVSTYLAQLALAPAQPATLITQRRAHAKLVRAVATLA